jgi:hypothetical protein
MHMLERYRAWRARQVGRAEGRRRTAWPDVPARALPEYPPTLDCSPARAATGASSPHSIALREAPARLLLRQPQALPCWPDQHRRAAQRRSMPQRRGRCSDAKTQSRSGQEGRARGAGPRRSGQATAPRRTVRGGAAAPAPHPQRQSECQPQNRQPSCLALACSPASAAGPAACASAAALLEQSGRRKTHGAGPAASPPGAC